MLTKVVHFMKHDISIQNNNNKKLMGMILFHMFANLLDV